MNKIKDRKVLIVDDSKLMRLLLKNIVDGMKFFSKIYEAENGREALDLLELNKVDLILLDIEMPVMDCLLYTSPSPRDGTKSRIPSSA